MNTMNTMNNPMSRTATVVIDFDSTRSLFHSRQDLLEFTADKLLTMLNWRASTRQVERAPEGHLTIHAEAVLCRITRQAAEQLSQHYRHNRQYQQMLPWCRPLFGQP